MNDEQAVALSLLDGLSRVNLTARLQADDPELLEQAASRAQFARDALTRAARHDIQFLAWNSPAYPPALLETPDAPPGLWLKGRRECLGGHRMVAIVGSRDGSPVALETAFQLARELTARKIVVVSGLARGVDSAAHRGALAAGGSTVAVLGSGLLRIYPGEHKTLADSIQEAGAVISEYAPDVPALPFHFPLRNRIISGLCRAVVVIEASEKSGSLITASCALEQGREVMAVPGNVLSGRNRGGHALIKDGAKIVESADDICSELGWGCTQAQDVLGLVNSDSTDGSVTYLLNEMQSGLAYAIDDLAGRLGMDAAPLLRQLTALELSGHIRRVDGGRFVRAS